MFNVSTRVLKTAFLGLLTVVGGAVFLTPGQPALSQTQYAALAAPATKGDVMSFYDLSAKSIDGQEVAFSQYKGKVSLVVNVASQCGFTPQYEGLQKLYLAYKDKGVVVLGFPSNEFGGQEPGTDAEIKTFCSTRFGVDFPMFSKVNVKKGDGQSPVYTYLTKDLAAPKWNFTKYLVGKDGRVLGVYPSNVAPDSAELKKAIEDALAAS